MTYFKPRDEGEHRKANAGYPNIPDYCLYCDRPFMDHYNGRCPTDYENKNLRERERSGEK